LLSFGMHIMEGFLPLPWAVAWFILMLPFIYLSIKKTRQLVEKNPKAILLLAFAGAFTFVLSALKLPSVTGSCSHPTGVALGAILFGPTVMVLIGLIVLLFQALLLAHGGLTTLGANVVSMAIIGPFVTYGVYTLLKRTKLPHWASVLIGAALGSLATYCATALQLALAYPGSPDGFYGSLVKFTAIFAVTQVPIAIIEGILTVLVVDLLYAYNRQEVESLRDMSIGGEQA
jgi:cobalt/nickel transport system permease protein